MTTATTLSGPALDRPVRTRTRLPERRRHQLETRSSAQFTAHRSRVYELVQQAQKGHRPEHR